MCVCVCMCVCMCVLFQVDCGRGTITVWCVVRYFSLMFLGDGAVTDMVGLFLFFNCRRLLVVSLH